MNSDGIVYRYTPPRHDGKATSMVVVFSSVAKNRFSQLLDRHFPQTLEALEASVSGHTAVLRIADMDGVVGGFYLPTRRDPSSSLKLANLIKTVAANIGIPLQRVVSYGASKGGTGALYLSLLTGINAVSIDPYVTTERRLTRATDPYFISSDIFPRPMQHELGQAASDTESPQGPAHRVLITSKKSAEYTDVTALAETAPNANIVIVESLDPHIGAHHQVASNTVAISLALINSFAQGLPLTLPRYSTVD